MALLYQDKLGGKFEAHPLAALAAVQRVLSVSDVQSR